MAPVERSWPVLKSFLLNLFQNNYIVEGALLIGMGASMTF